MTPLRILAAALAAVLCAIHVDYRITSARFGGRS